MVDTTISLHPFFVYRLDVGPIRAYNNCSCVQLSRRGFAGWRKIGGGVVRSRRAAGWISEDIGLPWGHQVAVMFQIVCALALEVPSVLLDIESLHGYVA